MIVGTTLERHHARLETLAHRDNILIGVTSHALAAPRDPALRQSKRLHHFETMLTTQEYARIFPAIECSYHLATLPSATFIHAMQAAPLRCTWRIMITDVAAEERYFLRDEWARAVAMIGEAPQSATIIFALDRTCEFNAAHAARLLEIVDALRPVPCLLEFEHHSWIHAERLFRGTHIGIVQIDAPMLPGIVKQIPSRGTHAYLRLLGRNAKQWFEHHDAERFCYSYSQAELGAIAARVRALRDTAETVTVVFANWPGVAAMENAGMFAERMTS